MTLFNLKVYTLITDIIYKLVDSAISESNGLLPLNWKKNDVLIGSYS